MAASNLNEIFNFVNKFLDLRRNGENANLSLQCQGGEVTINLQLHLPLCPRPYYHSPPPSQACPPSHRNTSRARRSIRRAIDRAKKAVNDAFIPPTKAQTAEKVDATTTVHSNSKKASDEAEQASESYATVKDPISEQLSAEQAALEKETVEAVVENLSLFHADLKEDDCGRAEQVQHHVNVAVEENIVEEKVNKENDERTIDLAGIMEDLQQSFTVDLRETVRQSIRDAFKPP